MYYSLCDKILKPNNPNNGCIFSIVVAPCRIYTLNYSVDYSQPLRCTVSFISFLIFETMHARRLHSSMWWKWVNVRWYYGFNFIFWMPLFMQKKYSYSTLPTKLFTKIIGIHAHTDEKSEMRAHNVLLIFTHCFIGIKPHLRHTYTKRKAANKRLLKLPSFQSINALFISLCW